MPIIDVHTHMFTRRWVELLRARRAVRRQVRPDGREEIFRGATPIVFPQPGHFDYDLRIAAMDAAGIDVSIAALPCEYPARAVEELSRSCDEGSVGVMVIANVAGRSLRTDLPAVAIEHGG